MSRKVILFFSIGAAIFLCVAGIAFFLWMPPAEIMQDTQLEAQYMNERFIVNMVYVLSVVLSCLMILPVIICLIIRAYKQYPYTIIIGGTIIILGFLFDSAANLFSLSLWASAIPESIKGDRTGYMLYKSIYFAFMALDFFAVALVYTGALIYGLGLRNASKLISNSMLLSVIFLFASFLTTPHIRVLSIAFMIGSFMAYAAGIFGIGLLAIKYEK
jgi:hypothetical protein